MKTLECPECGAHFTAAELDGRAAWWRIRVRIYDMRQGDEPRADSDPELSPEKPGALVVRGMPAVTETFAEMARAFHGETSLIGAGPEDLARKVKAFRPTLSRNKQRGTLRISYDTQDTHSLTDRPAAWIARIDIQQETKP